MKDLLALINQHYLHISKALVCLGYVLGMEKHEMRRTLPYSIYNKFNICRKRSEDEKPHHITN